MSIPAAYMLCVLLLFCIFVDVVDEAFCLDDLLHKLWECLTLILGSLCLVIDHTAVKIDLNGVRFCGACTSRFRECSRWYCKVTYDLYIRSAWTVDDRGL